MQSWYDPASGEIAESADDFEVPESTCWCITSVNVIGEFMAMPAEPMFDVRFYDDVNGLPAESPWLADTYEPTTITPVRIDQDFPNPVSHAIDLAAPVLVEAGRAWVSMIGHVTVPGRFSMNVSTDHFGLSTAYRREGDCPQWQHLEDCLTQYLPAELAFELIGHAVACE